MDRKEVAKIFEEIATLLELQGANPFRIRAYHNGARAILNLEGDLEEWVHQGKLDELAGIGADLAKKIETLVDKGKLPFYDELRRSVPKGLLELMQVPGLGGKKIRALHEKLGIASLSALKSACLSGEVEKLKGFGKKTQENLLDALAHQEAYSKRHLFWEALEEAETLIGKLRKIPGIVEVEIAGSLRRGCETIGDIDILIGTDDPEGVAKKILTKLKPSRLMARGSAKITLRLPEGMQADLRFIAPEQFGFALAYFTGSKEHNIRMRERAIARGWRLSEYGLEGKKSPFSNKAKAPTEKDIFHALGLPYIPPELREDLGEFAAAEKGELPHLVEEGDLRGAFHNHTSASDGENTLEEMVKAAENLGWEYIGISDHSRSSFQANGLSEERVLSQVDKIHKLNSSKRFSTHIFTGIECDILRTGELDFPDSLLKKLDFVIISVHNALQQDEKTMTARLIRAIENPYTTMVGHVTGRLLLRREACKLNLNKVIDACAANGKIIELNAQSKRLDMDWRWWRSAKEKGVLCSINPDAHHTSDLLYLRAGIKIARKGWLEAKNIFNTRSLAEVSRFLSRR
ncbi:MAG: DNA polymerase/3'-5' exonuclease PolX [Verrucomicrobiota bacterium]|nr:DNA polymerase/3'-5' exonuclease PolX [Verrucomicrobiota bacterium]